MTPENPADQVQVSEHKFETSQESTGGPKSTGGAKLTGGGYARTANRLHGRAGS